MSASIDPSSLSWKTSPNLLAFVGADGIFKHTNPAWVTILGRHPEDIEQKPFFEFVHPDDVERTAAAFADAQDGGIVSEFENRYRHKDGTYRWLCWSGAPEGDDYFCFAIDVTERKKTEEKLAHVAKELQLRDQLLEILQHDLRGPLATISVALQTAIVKDNNNPMIPQFIRPAQVALAKVTTVLNDVEDFANASLGGELSGLIIQADAKLKNVLEAEIAKQRAANSFVGITLEHGSTDPVACDPRRVGQVVDKLLTNAIVYGAADETITVKTRDVGNSVEIVVTNTGPNIPEETLGRMFKPFQRITDGGEGRGLGLSLYLGSLIAKAHGGSLTVTSGDHVTSFTLALSRP